MSQENSRDQGPLPKMRWPRPLAFFAIALATVVASLAFLDTDAISEEICGTVFMPHGHCYLWMPELLWLHVLSDASIALAYLIIPTALIYFIAKREGLYASKAVYLFSAFILLCGLSHAFEVYSIWYANYWLSGSVKAATAAVSLATATYLLKNVPRFLIVPLPHEFQQTQQRLKEESHSRASIESKLNERERLFELALTSGLDAFLLLRVQEGPRRGDNAFSIVALNWRAEQLLGLERSAAIGRVLAADMPLLSSSGILRACKVAALTRKPFELEFQADEASEWFYCQGVPVRDSLSLSIRNISQRKRAEQELESTQRKLQARVSEQSAELWRSESRYKLLTDFIYSAVWLTDEHGRVTTPIPSFEQLTGFAWEDYKGFGWLQAYAEQDREALRSGWQEAVQSGTPFEIEAGIWSAASRSYLPAQVKGLPIRDENGEILEWMGAIYDLSLIKKQEITLASYARSLQAKNQYLEEFAHVASHDLQEPLRKIRIFGDLLQEELGDQLSPDAASHVKAMQSASARMSALIQDLLRYSQIENGSHQPRLIELRDVIDYALSNLEIHIKETKAQIEIGPLPEVYADMRQLGQLFQNLVSNAIKYSQTGKNPQIEIGCETVDGSQLQSGFGDIIAERYHRIWVKDNGIGFNERYAETIFQPFKRLHGQGAYSGTGIGLSICKKIVERHAGILKAQSQEGQGSTFEVFLPAPKRPKNQEKPD